MTDWNKKVKEKNFFNGQIIKNSKIIIFILFWLLFLIIIQKNTFSKGIILYDGGDGFFHASRIFEIRYAFLHKELPNWLNFHTFYGLGQAINGMYPDITLWPLVILTLPFSFTNQVLAINIIILLLTVLVTAMAVYKAFDISMLNSLFIGTMYSLSGYSLYQFSHELQPGTAIIYIFSFPILFTIKNILISHKLDIKISLCLTLCITLVLYSHLLSAIVISFITGIIFMFMLIKGKIHLAAVLNIIIGSILAIITSLPILYRYIIISKSNIMPPFGQGNIQAEPLKLFLENISWDARDSLSILSIVIFLLVLSFYNENLNFKLKEEIFYLIGLELVLIIYRILIIYSLHHGVLESGYQ